MAIATYTFLPWLRRGISSQLDRRWRGRRAGLGVVTLAVTSRRARKELPAVTVSLIGPGDITAIQSQQIIRTEPRAGVTDFEPNYLAAIDFYDEDFPWRYSPALSRRGLLIVCRPGSCSSCSPTRSSRARQTGRTELVVRADRRRRAGRTSFLSRVRSGRGHTFI